MELLALFVVVAAVVGRKHLEQIREKVEALNNIWTMVTYHKRIVEIKETLERKMEALCSVGNDTSRRVEAAEFHTGRKRKREVENWLGSIQRKKTEVESMDQQISGRKYLGPWWENRLEKHIREVDELYEQGKFDSVLLDVRETAGKELLTISLVGQYPKRIIEEMWEYLMDETVKRIGVYGVVGVGKTAISMHIHNRVLQNATSDNATFVRVYWVTLSDDLGIQKLQNAIAKEVGLDLSDEEDTRKRAAKLSKGFSTTMKCVLILDGISSYFDQENIGIPTKADCCKLIVINKSLKLCRRMGCQKLVEINKLPESEADELFKVKLGVENSFDPEIEEIEKLIVKECQGLPGKIIRTAESMRGVDDINEWRYTLYTMQECRGLDDPATSEI